MKKLTKWLCLAACLTFTFTACSTDSDDGGSAVTTKDYNESGSAEVAAVEANTTIKNKVVNLNGSTEVYYEYLTFTSATGGTYVVKNSSDADVTESKTGSASATFAYDAATGKITVTVGTKTSYAYMVTATKNGEKITAIAKEILSTDGTDKTSLFNKWETPSKTASFTFNSIGGVEATIGSETGAYSYTNDAGWITIPQTIPFFWTKLSDQNILFYQIYQTERTENRSAAQNAVLSFVTNDFLFNF